MRLPPRPWLVGFGFWVGVLVILAFMAAAPPSFPKPQPSIATIPHCGETNEWLALVDKYLGTQLAEAQSGGPCVKISAQCQGSDDAYPGFKLEWFGVAHLPSWKYQLVIPGFEFMRPDGGIQAAGAGFRRWDIDPSVPTLSAGSGLITQLVRTETATGLAVDDDTYYRAAVYSQNTTAVQCAGTDEASNNRAPDCLRFRTRDLPPDPRYGVLVTSATCPWQAEETTEVSIPCGQTTLYTSPLSSNRGGQTEWEISGVTPVSASPILTSNTSQPPRVYSGTFDDGSTVSLSMRDNQVVASRTSPPGGVCDPPPPTITCELRINGLADASWQSSSSPAPTLTWSTADFRDGDTIEAKEYTASNVPTGKEASSNQAAGSTGLGSLPRVRPGESPVTRKYVATPYDTGAPNGSVRSGSESCEANLTITAESPPVCPGGLTCVGGCTPLPSYNSAELTWSPVANARVYRVRTSRSDGTILRTDDVTPPTTRITITGLAPSTSYLFSVQTIDQLDNSSALCPGAGLTATTSPGPGGPGGPPGTPALTLTAGPTCTQMTLSWPDVANETSYEVYRGPTSSGPWTLITSPALAANTTSYTDSGRTQLTSYSYYVKALNAVGPATSNIATATTDACGGPGGADFSVSVAPASRTVSPGQSTTYTVTVTSTSLPNTPITLSVTAGLPTGASATFAPNPVTTPSTDGSVTSTMTVSTIASTPLGTSSLTISGTGASLTRTAPTTLVVDTSGSNFTLDATPASVTVQPGETANYRVAIIPTNLPNTDITLAVTAGLPAGATASFGSNPVRTPASGDVQTDMFIATAPGTSAGTYPLTVRGSTTGASPIVRTDTVNLVVNTSGGPNTPPDPPGGPGGGPTPPSRTLMCESPARLTFEFVYTDPDTPPDNADRFTFQVARDAGFANLIVSRSYSSPVSSGTTLNQLVTMQTGADPGGVRDVLYYGQSYYWRVKAWDSRGAESRWSCGDSGTPACAVFSTPSHPYPQPDFTHNPSTLTPGTPIAFSADASTAAPGRQIVRWFWKFLDGVATAPDDADSDPDEVLHVRPPSTRSRPSATYSTAGAKTVTLTVQDDGGPEFTCSRLKVLFGGSGANLDWREVKPR